MAPRPEPIVAHLAYKHYRPAPGLDPDQARKTYYTMIMDRLEKEGDYYIDVLVQQHDKLHEEAFKADDPEMMQDYHTHAGPWGS